MTRKQIKFEFLEEFFVSIIPRKFNKIKINRIFQVYSAMIFILALFLEYFALKNLSGNFLTNFSFYLFLFGFVGTAINFSFGTSMTLLFLTISPAISFQLRDIFGVQWSFIDAPGLDAVMGWILASKINFKRRIEFSKESDFMPHAVLLFHFLVTISVSVTILRNLNQSASSFSFYGLLLNFQHARELVRGANYYPLRDFFSYSVGVLIFLNALQNFRKNNHLDLKKNLSFFFFGIFLNFILVTYTKFSGHGFVRDGLETGLNGFWPDLHSFAGLMVIPPVLVVFLTKNLNKDWLSSLLLWFVFIISSISLYWSGSRFTIFAFLLVLIGYLISLSLTQKGKLRFLIGGLVAGVLGLFGFILWRGFRGFDLTTLVSLIENFSFEKFNLAFSYRPEIFRAAWEMYSQFPFFGLGQGNFPLLSGIDWFSKSPYLISVNGENTHNYFLQTFVELGPVSLTIFLYIFLAAINRKSTDWGKVGIVALFGIALSNVFAHSLLIREMLALAFFFFAVFVSNSVSAKNHVFNKKLAAIFSVFLLIQIPLAAVEVNRSFSTPPFNYGTKCFLNRELDSDWTSGYYRIPMPLNSTKASFTLFELPPDVNVLDFDFQLRILGEDGGILSSKEIRSSKNMNTPLDFQISTSKSDSSPKFFEIRTSRCYVPLDRGLYYDSRLLGLKISKVKFE